MPSSFLNRNTDSTFRSRISPVVERSFLDRLANSPLRRSARAFAQSGRAAKAFAASIAAALLLAGSLAGTPAPARSEESALAEGLEPGPAQKAEFLQTICAGWERAERCVNAGKLVETRSLGWLIFEACSAAGPREIVVACFDRAHPLAAGLTGNPQFDKNYRHCNRFAGEQVVEAKLLCYRADFKYANYYNALRERLQQKAPETAGSE